MNVFYLDRNPKIAAQMHCDKHVVKMVLEYAQILSTAHRVIDGHGAADREGLYQIAHKNHPSTAWARSSRGNYNWLSDLWGYLGDEYTHRYGKIHASQALIEWCADNMPDIPDKPMTKMPQCMPDEFKQECSVSAYRHFYNVDKRSSFKCVWTDREEPLWWKEHTCLGA